MASLAAVAVKGFAAAKTAYTAIGGARTVATAGQFMSSLNRGSQIRKQKYQEAEAYRDASMRRMAATTREAAEERRKKERMHSRAIAVSAASGAGVDDPSVVAALGDLNAEGEYRVLSTLWSGQDAAAGLQFRSEAARREADTALDIGFMGGVNSAFATYNAFGGASKIVPSPTAVSPQGNPYSPSVNPPKKKLWGT